MPVLRSKTLLPGLLAFALLGAIPAGAQPWNPVPDAVAGQVGLVRTYPNFINGRGLARPQEVAVDTSVVPNRVYVYDVLNSRVLGWRNAASLANSAPADLVLGQPNVFTVGCNTGGISRGSLCSSTTLGLFWTGLAVDPNGNVYVGDTDNSRILEFDSPFTSDTLADRVLVAKDFTSKGCPPGPAGQIPTNIPCNTSGLAFDRDGNLYVADAIVGVFVYRQPLTTDTVPDGRIGHLECLSPDASSLCRTQGLTLDAAGNLYVADFFLNRILVFRSPLTTDNVADLVLGQPDLFSSRCNNGGRSARSLCSPSRLAVDGAGNLYVADTENHRVLAFDSPFTADSEADEVFGQRGSFTSGGCNNGGISARSLCSPLGMAVDPQGNLYVADTSNHRVLLYNQPRRRDTVADQVFGRRGSFQSGRGGACQGGRDFLCLPLDVAVDAAGNLYVADTGNRRVLEYDQPVRSGFRPDRVFGQNGSFTTSRCGMGRDSLCSPGAITLGPSGALYVSEGSRLVIVRYPAPLQQARIDRTFQGLAGASGMAADPAGNLYVADSLGNRVLIYENP